MSDTAPVTPATLGFAPASQSITLGGPHTPPDPASSIEAGPALTGPDKAFSRLLNHLAGQFSIRLAQADRTRDDIAAQSNLSIDLLRRIQAGEASDLTLAQLHSLAQALGGSPVISIQFPYPSSAQNPQPQERS